MTARELILYLEKAPPDAEVYISVDTEIRFNEETPIAGLRFDGLEESMKVSVTLVPVK